MVEDRNIDNLINELRSLKLRVSQVENQLRERREQEEVAVATPVTSHNVLTRGDRVRIINKIKRQQTGLYGGTNRTLKTNEEPQSLTWYATKCG